MSATSPDVRTVEQLLAAKEIVVTCGSGGVGKTTTAAALATMAATHLGGKALVLTVDPARRLANAMGLETFGNVETRVPVEAFAEAGIEPRGELWAAMLDTKQSWDDLVRRHAPDVKTRDAILANPLYQNVTGKFVQTSAAPGAGYAQAIQRGAIGALGTSTIGYQRASDYPNQIVSQQT